MKDDNLLIVKTSGRYLFLDQQNVTHVMAEGNYIRIYEETRSHLVRESLGNILMRLNGAHFLRVSRSAVINVHHIKEMRFRRSMSIEVFLTGGNKCIWSRSYRSRLTSLLSSMKIS